MQERGKKNRTVTDIKTKKKEVKKRDNLLFLQTADDFEVDENLEAYKRQAMKKLNVVGSYIQDKENNVKTKNNLMDNQNPMGNIDEEKNLGSEGSSSVNSLKNKATNNISPGHKKKESPIKSPKKKRERPLEKLASINNQTEQKLNNDKSNTVNENETQNISTNKKKNITKIISQDALSKETVIKKKNILIDVYSLDYNVLNEQDPAQKISNLNSAQVQDNIKSQEKYFKTYDGLNRLQTERNYPNKKINFFSSKNSENLSKVKMSTLHGNITTRNNLNVVRVPEAKPKTSKFSDYFTNTILKNKSAYELSLLKTTDELYFTNHSNDSLKIFDKVPQNIELNNKSKFYKNYSFKNNSKHQPFNDTKSRIFDEKKKSTDKINSYIRNEANNLQNKSRRQYFELSTDTTYKQKNFMTSKKIKLFANNHRDDFKNAGYNVNDSTVSVEKKESWSIKNRSIDKGAPYISNKKNNQNVKLEEIFNCKNRSLQYQSQKVIENSSMNNSSQIGNQFTKRNNSNLKLPNLAIEKNYTIKNLTNQKNSDLGKTSQTFNSNMNSLKNSQILEKNAPGELVQAKTSRKNQGYNFFVKHNSGFLKTDSSVIQKSDIKNTPKATGISVTDYDNFRKKNGMSKSQKISGVNLTNDIKLSDNINTFWIDNNKGIEEMKSTNQRFGKQLTSIKHKNKQDSPSEWNVLKTLTGNSKTYFFKC